MGGLLHLTTAGRLISLGPDMFQGRGASLLFTPLCFIHFGGVGRGGRQAV